jgi:diguanylate cyclase (GGDEF)-like protein
MNPQALDNTPNRFHELRQRIERILTDGECLTNDPGVQEIKHLLNKMEKEHREQKSMLRAVFDNSPYISVVVDTEGKVQNINHAGVAFAGLGKKELLDLLGGEVFGCINAFHGLGCGLNEECTDCPIRTRVNYTLTTGEPIFSGEGNMTFVREHRHIDLDILVSTTPIQVEGQDMVLVTIIDITDRKRIEAELSSSNVNLQSRLTEIEVLQEQLHKQAMRDPLTDMFNRRYLQETLEREVARASRYEKPVSLIIMDVDYFKHINDTYGHVAGDTVLVALAKLIKANCREGDIVCRYGGEEFIVVMPGASIQVAKKRADLLWGEINKMHVKYNEYNLQTTISMGIAAFPTNGSDGEEILVRADRALYQAKRDGRNRVSVFQDSLRTPHP